MAPRIGELRTRVRVMRISIAELCEDGQGGSNPAGEAQIFEAWARVRPSTGSDFFQAGQLQSRSSVEVVFRESRDVKSGDLIVFGDAFERRLRVQEAGVDEERGVWTTCACEELAT